MHPIRSFIHPSIYPQFNQFRATIVTDEKHDYETKYEEKHVDSKDDEKHKPNDVDQVIMRAFDDNM